MCHVPWPPLECPMMTTRIFEGMFHEVQGRFSSLSSFSNASTQYHTSVVLEPCQSKPYRRVSDANEIHLNVQTQDVPPDGIIVQPRPCRDKASLQKGRSRVSTPAPSDGNRLVSGLVGSKINSDEILRSATTDACGVPRDSSGGLTKNAVGVNPE